MIKFGQGTIEEARRAGRREREMGKDRRIVSKREREGE